MERPKYLEYRYRRDQISRYSVIRNVSVTLEKPALALLRMVGKKKSARKESWDETWTLELRVSDVRPDYSALVKTQVTEATRKVKGDQVGFEGGDPRNEFLNETVDQFGGLKEQHGSLPTPHLLLCPEEPQLTGGEWERTRTDHIPLFTPQGRAAGHGPITVVYRGRVDSFEEDEDGTECALIAVSGYGELGTEGDPGFHTFQASGNIKFALREGFIMSAEIVRSVSAHLEDKQILIHSAKEVFHHLSEGREQAIGGMRL